jgi:signal transduction histidine kinase
MDLSPRVPDGSPHDAPAEAPRPRLMLEHDVERLSARVEELERERAAAQGFAAVAAHELLQPLVMKEAYVTMVTEALVEGRYEEGLSDLEVLRRSATRVRRLIETLLHDARAAERKLELSDVHLGAVVDNCLLLLAPELQARQAHVDVEPLPTVVGEEVLLSGVFSNLFLNAIKYTPRDCTRVRVAARRRDDAWELSVESNGPTIPAEDRERIFQPFRRGTGERRASGSGLGLTICRNIVERHGGRIGVVPANGSGNRFWFTVPDEPVEGR